MNSRLDLQAHVSHKPCCGTPMCTLRGTERRTRVPAAEYTKPLLYHRMPTEAGESPMSSCLMDFSAVVIWSLRAKQLCQDMAGSVAGVHRGSFQIDNSMRTRGSEGASIREHAFCDEIAAVLVSRALLLKRAAVD